MSNQQQKSQFMPAKGRVIHSANSVRPWPHCFTVDLRFIWLKLPLLLLCISRWSSYKYYKYWVPANHQWRSRNVSMTYVFSIISLLTVSNGLRHSEKITENNRGALCDSQRLALSEIPFPLYERVRSIAVSCFVPTIRGSGSDCGQLAQ